MSKLISLVLILLVLPSVSAATLHGEIYDLDFLLIKDTIVTINSEPVQKVISKDGTYEFNIKPGIYVLNAKHYVNNILVEDAEENIEIISEGDFNLDLILFPSTEEEQLLYQLEEVYYTDEPSDPNYWLWIILGLTVVSIGLLFWKPKKKPEENDFDEADKVLEFIKSQGGRTTQKDIRKAFSMSEAKISILVTELEFRKKINKIKKGRGNIITLNRKN